MGRDRAGRVGRVCEGAELANKAMDGDGDAAD
eukprot:COSAG02_NODE_62327_length_266_cov_0.616766_1_plen_31_part_10